MTLRIFLALAILIIPAAGQAPLYKTQMFTLALDDQLENVFFLNSGAVQPLSAEISGLGSPFAYQGSQQFVLRASADEFAAKPPLPAPLATVKLPDQAKLVLLLSNRDAEKKIKLEAYDVSGGGFRAGDYRIFNFSEKSVSLILGSAKFALKPGEDKIVSDAALQQETLDVVVQIAQITDGTPQRVYKSVWGHQPVKRNYVFLFDGSHRTRPIAIRRFSDRSE